MTQAAVGVITGADRRVLRNAGAPASGTSGTFVDKCVAGDLLMDTTNLVLYVNEGTSASPYWTPVSFDQRNLLAYWSDFRDEVGKTIANTDATTLLAGSGLRVFGLGITETDSGLTVAQVAEVGPVASLIATNEDGKLAALGIGTTVLLMQPDVNGPLVVEAEITMDSAITLRAMFIGFVGGVADAMTPRVTGDTVTLTLVDDDLAGLLMDASLTDAAGLMAAHNKSNEAATLLVSATGVDTGSDMPAAGTYTRLRVEISAAGVMTCFKDKVQIASIAASLDADEEVAPVLYIEATEANTKQMDLKRFATWATRP